MSDSDALENTSNSPDADDHKRQPTVHGIDSIDASSISPNSIEGLFLLALQKTNAADRETFLNETCGDDADRRRRVTALLRAFNDAGSFMETPAGGPRPGQEVSLSFLKAANKEGVLGTIGPYEVLEVIGRGGMGVVLRAVDPKLNRVVAVKALLPELAANPNSRRRFLREAQAAAAISHPHVVTIHAVDDTHEDTNGKSVPPYLVMECVVGQSLQQKLDRVGTLRLAEILRISRQIGEGLAAAHRQGLIHRDIKPANILLENGVERVKITDFGLARAIDDITVTRTGEVCGTPQYMSPEQASGERVDHRSDLFSLGCVMYAMCTGHSPFRGDSIAHVIKRVTQDTPRPISDQNPEIQPWLIEIITCLLQKNPEHRFQSAGGLVVILDQHLSRIQHPTESGSHSMINQNIIGPSLTAEPRDSTQFAPRILSSNGKAYQTGTLLLGTGAMVVFGLVAWMLLVGEGVIDANPSVRNMAGVILAVSMSIAGACMIAGMLLREEIIGHAAWKKLFRLAGYALLGPIGIWLWILKESTAESSSRATLGPIPNRQEWGNRILWIAGLAIVLGFTGLLLYANDVAFLRYYRVIDGNSMTIILSLLGIGLVLAFVGGLLKGSSEGRSTSVLAFYLLLGPLGIVLWLIDRERRADAQRVPAATPNSGDRTIPGHAAGESVSPQNISMKSGSAIVHDVPIENYLLYAAIKRLGMTWILLTLGAAVFSFFSIPQPMLMQTPFEKIIQRLGEQATILLISWAVAMVVVSRRRQMSSAMFGLLSSSSLACILAGYFWATILRIPTSNGGVMLQTVIGMAGLPTICVVVFCGYVLRVMSRSEEFRKQSATPTKSARTLVWLLPFIFGCMLLSRWFNWPFSDSTQFVMSADESAKAIEFVAQRFHRPVLSVVTAGNSNSIVVLKAENGSEQRIHVRKSVTGIWELDPAHHATVIEVNKGDSLGPKNDEWGGLIVPELDPGLHLALIGSGPRIIGFAPPLLPEGRHKIPAGSYIPLIFDTCAGWLGDVKSNPQGDYDKIYHNIDMTMSGLDIGTNFYDSESGTWTVAQYTADPSHFDIKAGEFTTIRARRDLQKIANGSAYFNQNAEQRFVAGQFYRFLWNSEKFSLSSDQAIIVDILLKRLADGQIETSEQVVLDAAFEAGSPRADSVKTIFNLGNHPAWGKVVTTKSNDDATTISMVPLK